MTENNASEDGLLSVEEVSKELKKEVSEKYGDLSFVVRDDLGYLFKAISNKEDCEKYFLIRRLEKEITKEELQECLEQVSSENFLTEIDWVSSKIIITHVPKEYITLSSLISIKEHPTKSIPLAEYETLSITSRVLSILLNPKTASASEYFPETKGENSSGSIPLFLNLFPHSIMLNLAEDHSFPKHISKGESIFSQSNCQLKLSEPYSRLIYEKKDFRLESQEKDSPDAEKVSFLPPNFHGECCIKNGTCDKAVAFAFGMLLFRLSFVNKYVPGQDQPTCFLSYIFVKVLFELINPKTDQRMSIQQVRNKYDILTGSNPGIMQNVVVFPVSQMTNFLTSKSSYSGEMKYGQLHGRGTLKMRELEASDASKPKPAFSSDIVSYEGYFLFDRMAVWGKVTDGAGDVYEGELWNNTPNGQGVMTKKNGTVLRGGWEGGNFMNEEGGVRIEFEGKERMETVLRVGLSKEEAKEESCKGDLKDDSSRFFDQGEKKAPERQAVILSKAVYEGPIENGYEHGQGKLTFEDGTVWEGNFEKGKLSGENITGTLLNEPPEEKEEDSSSSKRGLFSCPETFPPQTSYSFQGAFKEGLKEGPGQEYLRDSYYYKGDYHRGQFEGKGCLVFFSRQAGKKPKMGADPGFCYEGDFKEGLLEGMGYLKNSKGLYKGQFKQGQKDGYGIFEYPDGTAYDGPWEKDQRNGVGQWFDPEEDEPVECVFIEDTRIQQ